MFTGIIETVGVIYHIQKDRGNIHFTIKSKISHELKIDQSVAHDGVCLTVVKIGDGTHTVTAINETLEKSGIGKWSLGVKVNLERCLSPSGRFDGHIVQGHVDTTAIVKEIVEERGSWRYFFTHAVSTNFMTVKKGSITVNGVSLTVVDSNEKGFSVALIPYTQEHTNFKNFKVGDIANLEFDIIGKYVAEMMRREVNGK